MQSNAFPAPVIDLRRRWRMSMTGVLGSVALALAALTLPPVTGSSPAQASEALANRIIVPARAPQHLRAQLREEATATLVARIAAERPVARSEVAAWLNTAGRSLADLLSATGIDPARLVHGAMTADVDGVGGPFVALNEANAVPELQMAALIERVRATVPLASPVKTSYRMTSGFGPRRDPMRGRMAFHRGMDMAASRGTPIHATAAGTVIRVGRFGAYGNLVEIDHGNGVQTLYAHLHEYHVRRGDTVEARQRIGRMGRTGRATGVHLHYEVIVDGKPVDPARFLHVGEQLLASAS